MRIEHGPGFNKAPNTVLPVFAFAGLAALVAGCPKRKPPAPDTPVQASSLPAIHVRDRPKMMFTFHKQGDEFSTVAKIADIPEDRRGWVRVVDLGLTPEQRRDYELVYVADLRKAQRDGDFPYVVMSRGAFEAAAINRFRAGATDPIVPPGAGTNAGNPAAGGAAVILYSTSWCGACKAARAWLTEHGVRFVDKDIESDPQAARELMAKAQRAGVSASGVPVLDVKGTLVQGFDAARISELLGKGAS